MKGAILRKGQKWYTDMFAVLSAISKYAVNYNWLVSDGECSFYPDERFREDYMWLTGAELLNLLDQHRVQFIWGVFSAFPPELTFEEIMAASENKLPYIQEYYGALELPLAVEHPLAAITIIPEDSTQVIITSKDDNVVERFREKFEMSEDYEEYRSRISVK